MKPNLLLLSMILLAMLSCQKTEESSGFPSDYSQQEIDDFKYVLTLSGHNENFIYDHSDDRQHRHFLSQLKRQGLTEETSPALFKSIGELREHHQSLRTQGKLRQNVSSRQTSEFASIFSFGSNQTDSTVPVAGTGVLTSDPDTIQVRPLQAISSLGMLDATTATATALSSIPDTAYYTQNTVQLLNSSGPVGSSVTNEEYYGGADLRSQAVEPYADAGPGVLAAKMTYYYKMTNSSMPVTGQFIASCKDCLSSSSCPEFQNIEPIGDSGQKSPITVCIYRKSAGECTYWYNNPSSHDIIFPVKGSVTFGAKTIKVQAGTNKVDGGTASMYITQNQEGGGCTMTSGTDFFAATNTVASGSTLTWDFEPTDFGNACFSSGESVNFVLSMKVPATDGTQMCAYVSNSTLADTAVFVTYEIGPMNVYYGCLAEGSMVTMADGSPRPIEQVEIGEKVLRDQSGATWTVTSNTTGIEPIPSVQVVTDAGDQLVLTQDHPVVVGDEVLLARELRDGMSLSTTDGSTTITEISMVNYDGAIWNLNLGQMDGERESLKESNSTFFANNILVGDGRMQRIYLNKFKNRKENVLSFLHQDWHQDYLNYLKRKGKS